MVHYSGLGVPLAIDPYGCIQLEGGLGAQPLCRGPVTKVSPNAAAQGPLLREAADSVMLFPFSLCTS